MRVPKGSFVALVGRNGAGKTTLMRSAMNLLPVSSGSLRIGGQVTTYSPAYMHARNGVGYMPEDRRLVPDWTVQQNIELPALASKALETKLRLKKIYEFIPEVAKFKDRRALELSGGQQKLVALARAFMASKNLLIPDEPFEGVAPALVHRLIDILKAMRGESALSILISESDAIHSEKLVDYCYTIERGKIETPLMDV